MKKALNYLCAALLIFGAACQQKEKEGNKEATEEEVVISDDERMEWWRDAGFGMFIHWGAYAVPGGQRGDTICGGGAEWIMDKLDYTIEDYEKEVVAEFNPTDFDANKWVAMAKDAGMKYIVITSKHHDGFCLWDSKVTDYDIMDASDFKRDIIKELAEACEKEGIKFCFYHSIVDWHHPQAQAPLYPNYNAGQKDQTVFNPEFPKYYENYLKPQVQELLTNYGDIGVVWFDGDWIPDYTTEMGKEMYNMILDIQPRTIVNNRVDKGRNGMEGMDKEGNFAGDFGTPEQEIPDTGIDADWEACMTMNGSWGYKPSDTNWKSSEDLIQKLVDIVSKGGNFLLNVGPDPKGNFPPESVERLADMGKWTKVNGEAIYGAQASPYERPEWGRYTAKDGIVYAHVFEWPEDGQLVINTEIKPKKITLLADSATILEWDADQSVIMLPAEVVDPVATVIKIEY
ncbi:alpha-L-fucosidase [Reichenbachiella agariperforans]|uniref:alpha-L-fucosidase n=1 Tax=Reichenbachiella agariperforans TaxID=156994 RepID=A0A1M6LXD8_REIAG|nr:alpha-L-fucosidase [Reichenbachiella agariperforans]SHJ75869.1 alpha-L-fucosidase [Reichenbachiella agariperforans]